MKYQLILFIAGLMLCSTFVKSQKLARIDNKVQYGDKICSLHELDSIFGTNRKAEIEYLKYGRLISARQNSKTAAVVLGGITALSSVYLIFANHDDFVTGVVLLFTVGTLGLTSGFTALIFLTNVGITHRKAKKRLNNAINSINQETGSLDKTKEHSINISSTTNGIGIAYSF